MNGVRRGDVHNALITFPDGQQKPKHLVVLQGSENANWPKQVAVVVASTWQAQRPSGPFEVLVGPAEGFDHQTVIQCRWVYTLLREKVVAGEFICTLPEPIMRQVDEALYSGLQMS